VVRLGQIADQFLCAAFGIRQWIMRIRMKAF